MGVGQVEYEVFPLVPDVVGLETEKEAEPIHEVVMGVPLDVGWFAEVAGGSKGGLCGADFGVTERRVVG